MGEGGTDEKKTFFRLALTMIIPVNMVQLTTSVCFVFFFFYGNGQEKLFSSPSLPPPFMPRAFGFIDASKRHIPLQSVRDEVCKESRARDASGVHHAPVLRTGRQRFDREETAITSFEWVIILARSGSTVEELIADHVGDTDDFIKRCLERIRDSLGAHVLSTFVVQ